MVVRNGKIWGASSFCGMIFVKKSEILKNLFSNFFYKNLLGFEIYKNLLFSLKLLLTQSKIKSLILTLKFYKKLKLKVINPMR